MKKYIYPFVAVITILSLVSCGDKQENAQQAGQQQAQATPVKSVKIPTDSVVTFKSYPTSIEGVINSDARPKVSGYITDVLVDEGEKVSQGQVLFKLETASLTEDAEAAKANVNAAQVQVDQLKPLVEKDIVSENELATAKAKLKQAQSNYHSVVANISYATVKSPVDGYVGTIRIRKGNLVSPSDPKPLTTVTDISEVYAYFSMNEKDYLDFLKIADGKTKAEKIKNMPDISLIMANGDTYQEKGTIQTVNSQVDKESGSVSFRAIFDNPGQLLTNGSTGKIRIPQVYKDILVVPQKSTYERQGYTYVMKVEKTDSATVAKTQAIEVKDEARNLYMVESGIEKGDEIVAEGVDQLQNGQPIKPNEQPFDSIAKPIGKVFED